jgi:hypothetical protein
MIGLEAGSGREFEDLDDHDPANLRSATERAFANPDNRTPTARQATSSRISTQFGLRPTARRAVGVRVPAAASIA